MSNIDINLFDTLFKLNKQEKAISMNFVYYILEL